MLSLWIYSIPPMICWKIAHASVSAILNVFTYTSCISQCDRRVHLTTWTPWSERVALEFRWFRIIGWCWDVGWAWGYGSIEIHATHPPHPLSSTFTRFWLLPSRQLQYGWLPWPCRRCPYLMFYLNCSCVTYHVAANSSSSCWIQLLSPHFQIFVHYLTVLINILKQR
jgi:hypothetical protein